MFISVALCTYNGELFLVEQLDSILNQTTAVDEIIICDDDSSDSTYSILESYAVLYPNKFKLYKNKITLGTIKNFEKAISLTVGDLIFLSDQDDLWRNDKVEKTIFFFHKNTNCSLLFSNGQLINDLGYTIDGTLWEKWGFNIDLKKAWLNNDNAFFDLIRGNNKITGATVCFSKNLKEVFLPIVLPLNYWHDTWIGLHAAASNSLYFMDDLLISYRVHERQQIGICNTISNELTLFSNRNYMDRDQFYLQIARLYPSKIKLIPLKKRRFFKKVWFRFKLFLCLR
jgi:glycosyltransferase involved in cell wall biosynthesis